jgi:hypothetical protein
MAHYQKLLAEDRALEEAIKAAEVAVDHHTVENRNKRKSMQERRNTLAQQMKLIGENAQQGQQSLQQLYASMESNLALAKHAEEWEWRRVGEAAPVATAKEESQRPCARKGTKREIAAKSILTQSAASPRNYRDTLTFPRR